MSPATGYVAPLELTRSRRWISWYERFDTRALSAWVLSLSLVLYLGIDGGGYGLATHSQVGIVAWWLVVLCAAWGLLPAARLTVTAKVTVGLLTAFTAWTALGITWSISSGRSFQDLTLITCYLGILVLAVAVHAERGQAIRHTTAAVATGIVIIAGIALSSRLFPHLFSSSHQTAQFLTGSQPRLSYPLNYWNALAALMAIGVPLLLAQATSARTLAMQGLAAAAVPLVAVCDALTISRGGIIEAAAAVFVFFALAPDRLPKLLTGSLTAAGSAVVVYAGLHRHAIQQGLTAGTAQHSQAMSVLVTLLLTSAGVGVAQAGIGLLVRHATPPRMLTVPVRRARLFTIAAAIVIVAAALAAGAPRHIHHAYETFKSPNAQISGTSTSRLASSSGEGRYQYWVAAVDSAKSHPLTGSGPGTFQFDWLPRAPFASYVINAHSLYVETYAELGLVGLVILVGLMVAMLVAAVRMVATSRYEDRTRAAAAAAALVAFMLGAAFDWLWQMPVLVAAVLLLVGAVLAPASADAPAGFVLPARPGTVTQVAMVLVGLACLVGIAYPLATSSDVAASQAAANLNNTPLALSDAQSAVSLEPGSGAAQLQLALVYEIERQYGSAVNAARRAVADEPEDWANWLILSRLQAEDRDPSGALASYLRAKSLNPHSRIFLAT